MSPWFLFVLVSLPIIEITLLVKLVGSIGFFGTVLLLLAAAAFGMTLLRAQGLTAWMRVQQGLAGGELPAREILDSGLLGLAGVLFIIPGIATDFLALVCLIPAVRARLVGLLLSRQGAGVGSPGKPQGPATLEGEFTRED